MSEFPFGAGSPISGSSPALAAQGTALEARQLSLGPATAWLCETGTADTRWDDFLQGSELGHFQQSSLWAAVKAADGWQSVKVVVMCNDEVIGGFQLLLRRRSGLREAFLNKGPVYRAPDPELLDWLLELLARVVRRSRITMLVCQPPDADTVLGPLMSNRGYAPNGLAPIITATFCIPLGKEYPVYESRMRRSLRLEARQAVKRGVIIREGASADVPIFFELMRATCRRQNSSPSPATAEAMMRLWSTFARQDLARLTLAECDGQPTAGLLCLRFGKTVTQWKKGWNEDHREKHPNTLLALESVQWAEKQGATCVDFVGGDRGYAKAILNGQPPGEDLRASRYFFLVGLGAQPRLLPLAKIFVPNPVFRAAYRLSLPILRRSGRVESE